MVIMIANNRSSYFLGGVSALLIAGGAMLAAPAHSAALDKNIATSYTALGTSINWQNDGTSTPQAGTLGPFNRACAIVEGKPDTKGEVMTRSVYVLDAGNGAENTVVLNIYARTDTITSSGGVTSDAETIVLRRQVVLSLTSQAGAVCYMAANATSVFASTGINNQASIIDKKTFAESIIQSFVTTTDNPVTQITVDIEGVVFLTFCTGPNARFAELNDAS
jgi:hypothetical protein